LLNNLEHCKLITGQDSTNNSWIAVERNKLGVWQDLLVRLDRWIKRAQQRSWQLRQSEFTYGIIMQLC